MSIPALNAIRGGKIARRGELHALVVAVNNPTTKCYLLMWTTIADQRLVLITDWEQYDLSSPTVEFVGHDRIMIASAKNNGPMRVTEYTLSEAGLTLEWDWTYGDATCRWGGSVRLADGGMVLATYRQDPIGNSQPLFHCDVVYRPAPRPSFSAPANPYRHELFHWPMFAGSQMPCSIQVAQASNGLAHVFWVADSFGQIGRATLDVSSDNIAVASVNSAWINSAMGDLSPSGEAPRFVVVRDGAELLLAYQNLPHTYHPACFDTFGGHDVISSRTVITRVTSDDTTQLEALLDWSSAHISFPWPCIWPRRDSNGLELYFLNEWLNPETCERRWRFGLVKDGQIGYGDDGPGKVEAWSDDGWIMFAGPGGEAPHPVKLNFRPQLKIERWSMAAQVLTELRVDWDHERPNQQLQSSTNLANWVDVPGATSPPVTVPVAGQNQFFRVKETV